MYRALPLTLSKCIIIRTRVVTSVEMIMQQEVHCANPWEFKSVNRFALVLFSTQEQLYAFNRQERS